MLSHAWYFVIREYTHSITHSIFNTRYSITGTPVVVVERPRVRAL